MRHKNHLGFWNKNGSLNYVKKDSSNCDNQKRQMCLLIDFTVSTPLPVNEKESDELE